MPKEPLKSIALSLLFPGLGHFYWGDIKRAKIFGGIFAGILSVIVLCLIHPTEMGDLFLIIILPLLFFYSIVVAIINYRGIVKTTPGGPASFSAKKLFIIAEIVACITVLNIPLLIGRYVADHIVQIFRISSVSMEPTLPKNGVFLIHKAIYKRQSPSRGDIIVFESPQNKKLFIKRLAGLGNDIVEIKEGKVYVNDQLANMPQNIYYHNVGSYGQAGQKMEIPMGYYFVLGDNGLKSIDSRFWGVLPSEHIIGKASKFLNF